MLETCARRSPRASATRVSQTEPQQRVQGTRPSIHNGGPSHRTADDPTEDGQVTSTPIWRASRSRVGRQIANQEGAVRTGLLLQQRRSRGVLNDAPLQGRRLEESSRLRTRRDVLRRVDVMPQTNDLASVVEGPQMQFFVSVPAARRSGRVDHHLCDNLLAAREQ